MQRQRKVVLHQSRQCPAHPLHPLLARRQLAQLAVDPPRALRDVVPIEAQHVLGGLGDQPLAQRLIDEQPLDHHPQVLGVAAVEAQTDALADRHHLAQPAGVGDDAGTARGHRLQRHQAEGLVDRRNHAQVGDAVERVQHVVADPAEEAAVLGQPEALGLRLQLGLVRSAARHQKAHVLDLLEHARHRVQRELKALLIDQPADEQHELLVRLGELRAQRLQVARRAQFARIDPVRDHRHAALVDVEDVRDVAAHVVGADDQRVGAPGHPTLDRMDVRLRIVLHPALMATMLGRMDRRHVRHVQALRERHRGLARRASRGRGSGRTARPPPALRPPPACRRSSARPTPRSGRGRAASSARARDGSSRRRARRPRGCPSGEPSPTPRVSTSTVMPWRTSASASLRT